MVLFSDGTSGELGLELDASAEPKTFVLGSPNKGPGLVWLWPILDRAVPVDLREQVLEVPHQTTITKDNAPISIDFLVYSRIIDPVASVVQVVDFVRAGQGSLRRPCGR